MQDLDSIRKRFLLLNMERMNRTRETLRSRQRDVMDMLPLLFHVNNASFPGYVSAETPVGISEYGPTKHTIDTAKKLVHGFKYQKQALPRYDLHALFLMGSCGSIAYNANSDFDIWLCHRSDLLDVQLAMLQEKASIIERWAEGYGLEVHFFLMDAEKFKKGENVEMSTESSGSAQHHLLLEEFYRTGLLFAGRYPLWWLVPPEEEKNYDAYAAELINKRFVREGEVIDFGGIPDSLEQEFFGASLWQLYKSVDSPYKAVLKLLLMETYATEHPNVNLLCSQFKQAIYDGVRAFEQFDPYIMLYNKIEKHLREINDRERLTLIQHCFYFKVGQQLSSPDTRSNDCWQRDVMKSMTSAWNWDAGYIQLLDAHDEWKIDRVLNERKILVEALTQSYQILSNFARRVTKLSDINQQDLHILGRKLYAAFERKAGKIELVNRGISNNIWESHITYHELSTNNQPSWALYQGTVFADDVPTAKPLKRSRSIVELIAWCFLNKLIDQHSAIALYNSASTITLNDIRAVVRGLEQMFPKSELIPTQNSDLINSPRIIKGSVFVNIGIEPSKNRITKGMHLTSDKSDALSYSSMGENLVLSIDMIVQNSWQEVLSSRYSGDNGLLESLGAYLQVSPPSQGKPPPYITCHCFTTGRGIAIAKRIAELFNQVIDYFYKKNHSTTAQYVFMISYDFYTIFFENDIYKFQKIGSSNNLLKFLGLPHRNFTPITFDKFALAKSPIPLIYEINKPNVIQLFYITDGHDITVYIADEKGSLFYQLYKNVDERILLNQYRNFLDAIILKQQIQITHNTKSRIEFNQLVIDRRGMYRLIPREYTPNDQVSGYYRLKLVTDIASSGQPVFTMYCKDKEYNSLEFGNNIFHKVARDIMEYRRDHSAYPIHITDLELSAPLIGKESSDYLQTIYFLNYKRGMEDKLSAAMSELAGNSNQAQA